MTSNTLTVLLFLTIFMHVGMSSGAAVDQMIRGGRLTDKNGKEIKLKGFNWFGFNNGQTMMDGLWSSDALSGDFATVVRRQKLLGFNAVRLPFSFQDFKLTPRSFVHEGCPLPTDLAIAQSVTKPGSPVPGPAPKLPNPPPAAAYQGNKCNTYLPNTSVRDRFIYVVKFYIQNGFYVIIDNHLREDQTALNTPGIWVQEYAKLVKDLAADPIVKENLIVDILNEPDNFGVTWETLSTLYLNAMDAIEASTGGGIRYAIEGTQQMGINTNWGDGFATERIEELGLGDPRPFFNQLLKKPYRNRVILAPHVYPPSVTYNNKDATGKGLFNRLSLSFGTKSISPGYCNGDDCIIFPVVIGEFGSRFIEPVDITMMNDFANYLNNQKPANDNRHAAIPNWLYWSWNANSADTGGLVANNWVDIEWVKIDYLQKIGLVPWYTTGRAVPVPEVEPPVPVPPILPIVPSPEAIVEPLPIVPSPEAIVEPLPVVPSPPTLNTTTACAVRVEYSGVWPSGSSYALVMNLYIRNLDPTPVQVPWKLGINGDKYDSIISAWNWQPYVQEGSIVGQGTESWLTLQPGQEVNVGMIVRGPSDKVESFYPATVSLNDQRCIIEQARLI